MGSQKKHLFLQNPVFPVKHPEAVGILCGPVIDFQLPSKLSVTDRNPLDQISEYTVMVTIRRRGRPCFSHGNSKKPCDMVQKLAVPGIELSVSFHQGDPSALGTVIIDK